MDNPFLQTVLDRAVLHPENTFAWIHQGSDYQKVTNKALVKEAVSFSTHLRDRGLRQGDLVFIIARHGKALYSCFLGAMLAGAIPSFLPFPNPKQDKTKYWETHRRVFERSRAAFIVTYPELIDSVTDAVAGLQCQTLDYSELDERVAPPETVAKHLPEESLTALLQHSSGTTGLKKGVSLSYLAIRLQVESYARTLGLHQSPDTEVRIASWLPLYHDMGLIACFMLPLYLGIPIISLDAFTWTNRPALLLESIETFQATHAWLPNFAFRHLVRAVPRNCRYDLSSVQGLVSCSEPPKANSIETFLERYADQGVRREAMQASYAMAETVFAISQTPANKGARVLYLDASALSKEGRISHAAPEATDSVSFVSNGPPIDGVDVRVLRDGKFVSGDLSGELCVRAAFLFSGYFQDRATTNAAFHGEWFRTGDIGFINEGEIFVSGRIKDLLIINGRNFFAHDLEAAVSQVRGVKPGRCVVFGIHAENVGSEVLVVVAERAEQANPEQDIGAIQAISRVLSAEFGLSAADIRLVDQGWLVKTTSGKTSRADNLTKYQALSGALGTR